MILPAIQERRSVREYETKEVPQALIWEIIQAAQYAPTGMNNRAVEYVVLRGAETKKRLFEILEPKQPFIKEAPAIIIPVTDTRKTIVATADLAIASSFIMTQTTALGLGTVWKHIDPDKAHEVGKFLGLPPEYILINALPVGYPKKKMPDHQEKEFSENKIHQEKW
jgi:nitroreductase